MKNQYRACALPVKGSYHPLLDEYSFEDLVRSHILPKLK